MNEERAVRSRKAHAMLGLEREERVLSERRLQLEAVRGRAEARPAFAPSAGELVEDAVDAGITGEHVRRR
jgi:hypothetical protein